MGQPKIMYWKLHELHKNEVKTVHPNEHMPKNLETDESFHVRKACLGVIRLVFLIMRHNSNFVSQFGLPNF